MCSPIIGAVVSAAGTLFSAVQQSGASRAQARIARNNAIVERRRNESETRRARQLQTRRISSRRVRALASGIAIEGSPAEVIVRDIGDSELDIRARRFDSEVRARNEEARASLASSRASSQIVGGAFGAITPLIRSVSQPR